MHAAPKTRPRADVFGLSRLTLCSTLLVWIIVALASTTANASGQGQQSACEYRQLIFWSRLEGG